VVSGEERLAKPDPRIFELLLTRHGLDAARTVFVDDGAVNVEAARAAGLQGLVFTDEATLRRDLDRLGVLPSEPGPAPEGPAAAT
jgi:2-haloacid dehalogenase